MLLKKLNFPLTKIFTGFEEAYNERTFLVFFRITISLIAIFDVLSMFSDFGLLFSASKTVIPQELLYITSEYFIKLHFFYDFLLRNQALNFFYYNALWVYLASLIFLLAGFFSRPSAFVALVLQLLIFKSFPEFNYGYDNFLSMSLFYCLIFPTGKYYSLSNKFYRKKNNKPVFNYKRVIQIHLSIVYFFSGVSKILAVSWWNGNAMWNAVASIHTRYYQIPPLILASVGIGTILLETFYPLLVLKNISRKITISLIILMHISIAIMLELYSFGAIMIVWNLVAFTNLTNIKPENENTS